MVSRKIRYFLLTKQGRPREARTRETWQAWMSKTPASERVVAQLELAPGVVVETMFDGIDKGEKPGVPFLWSTRVYGVKPFASTVWKWSSTGEAIEGHKGTVDSLMAMFTWKKPQPTLKLL